MKTLTAGANPRRVISQMAKGQIQLNRAHPETIFRVRLVGLQPTPLHSDADIEALVVALSDVWSHLILSRAA